MSDEDMKHMENTPDCGMRESLVAYLYGEATAEESRRVEAHLSACEMCGQEMAAFERVRGMLQQWQLDDLPVVRVETAPARNRSALDVLKELMTIMPVWAKAVSVAAAAMIVLAVLGTEVSIGDGRIRIRADIFRPGSSPASENLSAGSNEAGVEQLRAELKQMVETLVAESDLRQTEQLKARLVSFESQLQNMHAADLAKLADTVQQHRARLRVIERDIDRREGYDLADILFGELNDGSRDRREGRSGSDD